MTNQEVQVLNQDLIQEKKMEEAQEMIEREKDLETERMIEEEAIETATAQQKEVVSRMISPA